MAKIDLGSVVGPVGPQGPKPVKGTDYYTEEEKQQFTTETVGLVTTEGTKQTKSVTDEGTKQVQLITEKISEITSTGDLKLNAITTEGKNKLEAVTNEGNRILSEIGKILETSPEGGNALQLGGKTRSEFDKEIQGVAGGYAGKFPLDSAVLDGIYLLPDTGKFYVCTKAFSDKELIVPDSNFEELSVYKNRDKLSNLTETFETYDSASNACLSGEPYKTIQINGKTKYIGFTKDLDAKKASMLHYKIDGEEYALRKYRGKTNMRDYGNTTYSDWSTRIDFPSNFPDTSDATDTYWMCRGATNILEFPDFDLRNSTNCYGFYGGCTNGKKFGALLNTGKCKMMFGVFHSCNSAEEFPYIDTSSNETFEQYYESCIKCKVFPDLKTSKGTNFHKMHNNNNELTEIPNYDTSNATNISFFVSRSKITKCDNINTSNATDLNRFLINNPLLEVVDNIDTSKCKNFEGMFWECGKLRYVCPIDLSALTLEDITTNRKLIDMLTKCNSLNSITFNNVPVGITVDQMRIATSAPSTCEIILNHRSE